MTLVCTCGSYDPLLLWSSGCGKSTFHALHSWHSQTGETGHLNGVRKRNASERTQRRRFYIKLYIIRSNLNLPGSSLSSQWSNWSNMVAWTDTRSPKSKPPRTTAPSFRSQPSLGDFIPRRFLPSLNVKAQDDSTIHGHALSPSKSPASRCSSNASRRLQMQSLQDKILYSLVQLEEKRPRQTGRGSDRS